MEAEQVCKHCNHVMCDDSYKSSEATFTELVNNCKGKQEIHDVKNVKLGRPGVLKWLLTHASQKVIDPLDVDKIVDQCVFSSEDDMLKILQENEVFLSVLLEYYKEPCTISNSSLSCVAKCENPEILSWVLTLKINETITGNILMPILFNAIVAGKLNNIKICVDLGADVKMSLFGESALEIAARNGHLHIVEWLFDNDLFNKNCFEKSLTNTLEQSLYLALANSHFHVVKYIIENTKVDLNYVLDIIYGGTVLHVAANLNNVNLIKWLLEKGTNLFAKNYLGKTIADIAVENGNLNMLKWLSSQDPQYEQLDSNSTLLHKAAFHGYYDCVEYLVHKTYDVGYKDEKGQSVLQCAVQSGNVNIVNFLMAHGAQITKDDESTLVLSAYNSLEMLQLLASLGLDLNIKTFDKDNVLSLAACCNNYDAVKWLLEQGMDITEVVKYTSYWLEKTSVDNCRLLLLCIKYMKIVNMEFDTSILHKAVSYPEVLKIMLEYNFGENCVLDELGGKLLIDALHPNNTSFESAYYLLAHGSDVTVIDNDGKTALYNAVFNTDMPLIKKLIELGSDVNAQTHHGDKILDRAIISSNLEVVKYIVDMGANIHIRNYRGSNVVNIASCCGRWDMVKYFVELGVNINNYSVPCDPILYKAIDSCDSDVVELISWLLNHGARPNIMIGNRDPILHELMSIDDENTKFTLLKLLIDHGANVNALDANNGTILFHCLNNLRMANYLIDVGINVNVQRDDNFTALHALLDCNDLLKDIPNYMKIAIKLINHGANVNSLTTNNETALHYAVRLPHCNVVVRKLIQAGCDINAKDISGNTALHLANDINIAMLLIKQGADVNSKDANGLTVLQNAMKNAPVHIKKQYNIISFIQKCALSDKKNAKYSNVCHHMDSILYSRNISYIEFLISIVDDTQENSDAIINFAINHDNVSIMKTLLFKNDFKLLKSIDRNTLLQSATLKGSLNIVAFISETLKNEVQ